MSVPANPVWAVRGSEKKEGSSGRARGNPASGAQTFYPPMHWSAVESNWTGDQGIPRAQGMPCLANSAHH